MRLALARVRLAVASVEWWSTQIYTNTNETLGGLLVAASAVGLGAVAVRTFGLVDENNQSGSRKDAIWHTILRED